MTVMEPVYLRVQVTAIVSLAGTQLLTKTANNVTPAVKHALLLALTSAQVAIVPDLPPISIEQTEATPKEPVNPPDPVMVIVSLVFMQM